MQFIAKVWAFLGKIGGKRFLIALGALAGIVLGSLGYVPEATVTHWTEIAVGAIAADGFLSKFFAGWSTSAPKPEAPKPE